MVTTLAPLSMRPFRGAEKVAVLPLAMDRTLASGLLKQFSEPELRSITRSAADLGAVPIPALEALIEEFAGHFSAGADLVGSIDDAEQLLAGALPPEQVSGIMADALGASNLTVWERLSSLPEQGFRAYLTNEHPQTAALILSKLAPAAAAKLIAEMPATLRNALTRRMLAMRTVPEPMVKLVETVLTEDLLAAQKNAASQAQSRMADIVNRLDRAQVEDLLENLAEANPEAAEALRSMLFSFEDVVKLSDKARLQLFERVPTETVILALKGAEAELASCVLASLGARARRMVEQELAGGDAGDPRDITAARRSIADTVLDLAGRGLITLDAEQPG